MVSVEDATTARLSRDGSNFEILVDPDLALRLKRGGDVSIENVLATPEIYSDAKKGERVPLEILEKVFKTTDVFRIAESIIKHGELQITTEQRNKFADDKKKEIASIISRQGMDPKTKLPHPQQRILNAMQEAKVNIDPMKPAKEQVNEVLSKIEEVLPISLERIEVTLRVPMEHAGRVSSEVRNMASIKSEEWKSDSWMAVIEIPAGMQSDIYDKLNSLTSGKVDVKILKEHKI